MAHKNRPKLESPGTWKYSSREIRRETDITGAPKPLWATLPESTSTLHLPSNDVSPRAVAVTRDLEELANSFGTTPANSGAERHRIKRSGKSLPEGFTCLLLFLPDFRFPFPPPRHV